MARRAQRFALTCSLVLLVAVSLTTRAFAQGQSMIPTCEPGTTLTERAGALAIRLGCVHDAGAWEGSVTMFSHDDRTFLGTETYIDGVREGFWMIRHADGEQRARGHFDDGRPEGFWTFWGARGDEQASGHFLEGLRHGTWRFVTSSGERPCTVVFDKGAVARLYPPMSLVCASLVDQVVQEHDALFGTVTAGALVEHRASFVTGSAMVVTSSPRRSNPRTSSRLGRISRAPKLSCTLTDVRYEESVTYAVTAAPRSCVDSMCIYSVSVRQLGAKRSLSFTARMIDRGQTWAFVPMREGCSYDDVGCHYTEAILKVEPGAKRASAPMALLSLSERERLGGPLSCRVK